MAKIVPPLNDTQIKNAKLQDQEYNLGDSHGDVPDYWQAELIKKLNAPRQEQSADMEAIIAATINQMKGASWMTWFITGQKLLFIS